MFGCWDWILKGSKGEGFDGVRKSLVNTRVKNTTTTSRYSNPNRWTVYYKEGGNPSFPPRNGWIYSFLLFLDFHVDFHVFGPSVLFCVIETVVSGSCLGINKRDVQLLMATSVTIVFDIYNIYIYISVYIRIYDLVMGGSVYRMYCKVVGLTAYKMRIGVGLVTSERWVYVDGFCS